MMTIQISGLDEIVRKLEPTRAVRAFDLAVDRAAEALRDTTRQLPPVSARRIGYGERGIPVDSGRMRQAIQKRKTQLLAAEVGAFVKYSGYVHDGTGKMPARPFFEWSFQMGGEAAIERAV